jgi:hypothetical protein
MCVREDAASAPLSAFCTRAPRNNRAGRLIAKRILQLSLFSLCAAAEKALSPVCQQWHAGCVFVHLSGMHSSLGANNSNPCVLRHEPDDFQPHFSNCGTMLSATHCQSELWPLINTAQQFNNLMKAIQGTHKFVICYWWLSNAALKLTKIMQKIESVNLEKPEI